MAEQTGVPYDRGWAWMIVVGKEKDNYKHF